MSTLRSTVLSLIFFSVSFFSNGQPYQKTTHGLKAWVNNQVIEIDFYYADIVRIVKHPACIETRKESFSVIAKPQSSNIILTREGNDLILKSSALKVALNSKTGKISYYTLTDKQIFSEKEQGNQFTPEADSCKGDFAVKQEFILPHGEGVYGLGQHQQGIMNYRGKTVELRQRNMDIAIPFIQSSAGYGVFWDNTSTTTFKDDALSMSFSSVVGDRVDYYFMNGGSMDKVIAQMRKLTGEVPMFPRWVFGFFQSRERYRSQAELLGIIKKYRESGVPLDGIVQDWQYWGTGDSVWNGVTFGNPLFPEPKKMIDSVHTLNAHIIISVWPSFGVNTSIYKSMAETGALFDFKTWPTTPAVKVYDPFNPVARNIYWDYMNRNLFSLGMDGWWLDATEPEQGDTRNTDKATTHAGSFKKVANAFPIASTGGVYDNQRKASNDKRVFILTRSAFAGQQRYGTATWSGDIQGNWRSFRNQVSGGLNLSLSSIPYWNTDIGGFFTHIKYPRGIRDPAFHELYTRWLEFATFTPLFRSHGTDTPREIFQFGSRGSWAYDVQEKFINLRYRLLPYIYSTAWEITSQHSTMMRALIMDFPKDEKVLDINNEFMFGKAFLVAPVTDSMYVSRATGTAVTDFSTIKMSPVYLPKGSQWIDFWNGNKYSGGNSIERKAPIDEIPVFVKAGSIVPFGPYQQYTSEKKADSLEIRVYPGQNGRFTLYEDENDNYNYEKGIYSTIEMTWNDKAGILTISNRKGTFPGMLNSRVFNIVKVSESNGNGSAPVGHITKRVNYSGKTISVKP